MKARPQPLALEPLEDRTLLATCTVTNLGDVGKGAVLTESGQGTGDLRFCINQANATPGPDVIDFTVTGTINLSRALPELASDIDIQGPGADVLTVRRSTNGNYRIFTITSGSTVQVKDLSITRGRQSIGGGILNAGNLRLDHTVVNQNEALNVGRGGGIYNNGTLSIANSSVLDNFAVKWALAHGYGGGIFNDGVLQIDSSTIAGNFVIGWSDEFGYGGGVCNYTNGTMVIENSTIANNSAQWGGGGVISFGPSARLHHSTVAGNHARVAGGVWSFEDYSVTIWNTIVATNTASQRDLGPDVIGQFMSAGHNLISNSDHGSGFSSTDQLDVVAMLGPLQDNGGPTLTMVLLPGSPAIDAGDNNKSPVWDQRGPGFPRIVNGTIDIGAFEVQATGAPSQPHFLAFLITADSNQDESETIR